MCRPKRLTQTPFNPRGFFLQVAAAVMNWWGWRGRDSLLGLLKKTVVGCGSPVVGYIHQCLKSACRHHLCQHRRVLAAVRRSTFECAGYWWVGLVFHTCVQLPPSCGSEIGSFSYNSLRYFMHEKANAQSPRIPHGFRLIRLQQPPITPPASPRSH
jgi:hypothetical protein